MTLTSTHDQQYDSVELQEKEIGRSRIEGRWATEAAAWPGHLGNPKEKLVQFGVSVGCRKCLNNSISAVSRDDSVTETHSQFDCCLNASYSQQLLGQLRLLKPPGFLKISQITSGSQDFVTY